MPRYRRGKSMSSLARRLRKLRSNQAKQKEEPKTRGYKRRRKENDSCTQNVADSGRIILSLACVLQIANAAAKHNSSCGSLFNDAKLLNGNIELVCGGCSTNLQIPVDLGINNCSYNKALTLAAFTSGTGWEAINTILATLSIPPLSFAKFQNEEEVLFTEMFAAMQREFDQNAQEEYRLAMEAGDFIVLQNGQRIPFITVVVDGGWNKRSYGHRYDSNAGVAVIIGARTKKFLYMDWRIKTCAKCNYDRKTGKPETHRCFKNWTESAQSMEADIIVEGFKLSMAKHGLIYRYMVGDADSSVFFKVKAAVHYPVEIEKIDCVNHAMRCVTSKLHGIAKNTAKAERDAVNQKIAQMAKDAKGAINYNHSLKSQQQTTLIAPAKLLYDDIVNIPRHVFGDHTKCKEWTERIYTTAETDAYWEKMKKCLVRFFMEDIAPEIVHPRFTKGLPIRQPLYRVNAMAQSKSRNENTVSTKKPRIDDVLLLL